MNDAIKTLTIYKQTIRIAGMLVLTIMEFTRVGAQQIPNYSLYNMNHYLINPAASGTTDQIPVSASFRKMYAGIDNSPSVEYLSAHMKPAENMGVGAKIFNFQAGPLRKTGLELTYSYHIAINAETKLSFGLSLSGYQFNQKKSGMYVQDPDDIALYDDVNTFAPDAGIGTYLYGKNYFVGLAVPQLFQKNIDFKSDEILQGKQVRHYYLHGGYRFTATPDITIEPSALLKFVEAGIFQADINAVATYKEMINFGISYRTEDAMSFQVGYSNPDLFVGYAYDLVLSSMRGNTWGSHEILFTYKFPNFLLK